MHVMPKVMRRPLLAFGLACLGSFPVAAEQVFDCVIEPSQIVRIGSPVSGVLRDVTVGRGDQIVKGQLLAQLEDRVEVATVALQKLRASDGASLAAQQARLTLSQTRLDRARELLRRRSGTKDAVEQATAEFVVNQAEIERIEMQMELAGMELARSEAALSLLTIKSPVDGIVIERVLSAGEFVNQDAHILRVAVIDPLFVEVYLPVAYYAQLKMGQTGTILPIEPVGGSYEAEIAIIDRIFDATSNTFGVRLTLSNPDFQLPAGQRCRAKFDIEPLPASDAALGLN